MQQNQIKLDLKSVEDFSNTFISPIICFISIISNLLNINIFNRLRTTDRFYQYLYYKSTVNCTYLVICLLSFTFKCGNFCQLENIYITKMYELYLYQYFSNCLYMLEITTEISICLNRYLKIKNNKFFKNVRVKMIVLAEFIFSLLFYIPVVTCFTIIKKEGESNYIYVIELDRNCSETNEFFNLYDLLTRCILFICLIILILIVCYSKRTINVENSIILMPIVNGKINILIKANI